MELPPDLDGVREQITLAVSNDEGEDRIGEVKHNLHALLEQRLPTREDRADVINALLVRAWLGALRQVLTRLIFAASAAETQVAGARELADTLGVFVRGAAIPYGALGRLLFGFRVTKTTDNPQQGQLSTQAIAGDPHTTTVQLGGTVALAASGVERIVVGLSATAFFPGAAREHILTPLTWSMTDAHTGGVVAIEGTVIGEGIRPVRIAGLSEGAKAGMLLDLGRLLWEQHLGAHFDALLSDSDRKDRARVLVVANSYRQVALLAEGLAAVADPRRIAVAVSSAYRNLSEPLPRDVVPLAFDQFETFPGLAPADILIAPITRVARGLNILVPGEQRSAISSIWVCVRPVAQLQDAAEMFASINAHGIAVVEPCHDPTLAIEAQRRAANRRLGELLRADPRFSFMPRKLKAEMVAGMLVDLIQLAGRARRGGTPVELYFVDGAFHDERLRSDLPSLVRFHQESLTEEQRAGMRRVYGDTLTSVLDYAGAGRQEAWP